MPSPLDIPPVKGFDPQDDAAIAKMLDNRYNKFRKIGAWTTV